MTSSTTAATMALRRAIVRYRAQHGHDAGQRELGQVVDAADRLRARSLEQAQAPLLVRRVDALHVANPPAALVLPADGLAQGPVHCGQLPRRQAAQVMLDQEETPVGVISHGLLRHGLRATDNGVSRLGGHPGNPRYRYGFPAAMVAL